MQSWTKTKRLIYFCDTCLYTKCDMTIRKYRINNKLEDTKFSGRYDRRRRTVRSSMNGPLPRLTNNPRIDVRMYEDQNCRISKSGKKECQDNRKNRRKECVNQGQRTCARIGNCLVRVLACIFDWTEIPFSMGPSRRGVEEIGRFLNFPPRI